MIRTRSTAPRTLVLLAAAIALAAVLTALLASAAGADPAAGSDKYKIAKFKVEVKGVQKTTETFHHQAENACDDSDTSSITEKVVFKSKPREITAYHMPGSVNPLLLNSQAGKWTTAATVTRNYTPRIVSPPPSPECGENDGGESQGPKYDCGTKKVPDWSVELEFDKKKKGGLRVLGDEHGDPFENCLGPAGDLGFSFLIIDDTKDKPILGELPEDELFDEGIGKLIVFGKGVKRVEENDVTAKVSIEWDVSLTRLKGK